MRNKITLLSENQSEIDDKRSEFGIGDSGFGFREFARCAGLENNN